MRADRPTDKQTDRHADHNTLHPYRGRNNNLIFLQKSTADSGVTRPTELLHNNASPQNIHINTFYKQKMVNKLIIWPTH